MRKQFVTGLKFYLIAPFVFVITGVSIVVSVQAALENYRVGQATEQILRLSLLARDMRVQVVAPPVKALKDFMSRAEQEGISGLRAGSPALDAKGNPVGPPEKWIENPWGNKYTITFEPPQRWLRLETIVSPNSCRRILLFYAKDIAALGLLSVDIRESERATFWRKIYPPQSLENLGRIQEGSIYGGCNGSEDLTLLLTFSLDNKQVGMPN